MQTTGNLTQKQIRVLALARAKRYSQSGEGREIRLRHRLALGDIASGVGVAITSIHRWENARNVPHGDAAVRWAELLDALVALNDQADRNARDRRSMSDRGW